MDKRNIFDGAMTVREAIEILQNLPEDQKDMPLYHFNYECSELMQTHFKPSVRELIEIECRSVGVKDNGGNNMPNYRRLVLPDVAKCLESFIEKEHSRRKVILL